jgi:hypothetical protein
MKKLCVLFFSVCFLLLSCSDSSSPSTIKAEAGTFIVKIDGNQLIAKEAQHFAMVVYVAEQHTISITGSSISTTGTTTTTNTVTINMNNITTTGSFNFGGTNNPNVIALNVNTVETGSDPVNVFYSSMNLTDIVGTINITKFDVANNIIEGNFSATVWNAAHTASKVLSEGAFNLSMN